jgi:hypothetical protein
VGLAQVAPSAIEESEVATISTFQGLTYQESLVTCQDLVGIAWACSLIGDDDPVLFEKLLQSARVDLDHMPYSTLNQLAQVLVLARKWLYLSLFVLPRAALDPVASKFGSIQPITRSNTALRRRSLFG